MRHRFVVPDSALRGERIAFSAAQARQMSAVLRLKPGEIVLAIAGGEEAEVRLDDVGPAAAGGIIVARRPSSAEPRVELTLALPVLRGARSEEIVEAATQLGVERFVPLASARSVVRALPEARRERWARIAREAAETARRARVPVIERVHAWPDLFAALPAPVYVAWEEERERQLLAVLARQPRDGRSDPRLVGATGEGAAADEVERLSVVIGPEGGLTEEEVALARERGAIVVSLGRRNLRAETAAIAAVAVVMAALD